MLEAMGEDFVRAGRSRGSPRQTATTRRSRRAAPVLTVYGLDLAGLLSGAIITETVFNIQGIGRLALTRVELRPTHDHGHGAHRRRDPGAVQPDRRPAYALSTPGYGSREQPRLEVAGDLRVPFRTDDGVVKAVDGVSLRVDEGETLGIVGESGCGKSVTARASCGLQDRRRTQAGGQVLFDGRDLLAAHRGARCGGLAATRSR